MKHPHKEIIDAYTADTSVEIEIRRPSGDWCLTGINAVIGNSNQAFRLKPKTMRIGEHEFPEPLRTPPRNGTAVWYLGCDRVYPSTYWVNDPAKFWDKTIKAGFCQATEAGAIAQRRAIIAACGGVE